VSPGVQVQDGGSPDGEARQADCQRQPRGPGSTRHLGGGPSCPSAVREPGRRGLPVAGHCSDRRPLSPIPAARAGRDWSRPAVGLPSLQQGRPLAFVPPPHFSQEQQPCAPWVQHDTTPRNGHGVWGFGTAGSPIEALEAEESALGVVRGKRHPCQTSHAGWEARSGEDGCAGKCAARTRACGSGGCDSRPHPSAGKPVSRSSLSLPPPEGYIAWHWAIIEAAAEEQLAQSPVMPRPRLATYPRRYAAAASRSRSSVASVSPHRLQRPSPLPSPRRSPSPSRSRRSRSKSSHGDRRRRSPRGDPRGRSHSPTRNHANVAPTWLSLAAPPAHELQRVKARAVMLTGGPFQEEWTCLFFVPKRAPKSLGWTMVPIDYCLIARDLEIGLSATRTVLMRYRIACADVAGVLRVPSATAIGPAAHPPMQGVWRPVAGPSIAAPSPSWPR
jgi:hypothetical protein